MPWVLSAAALILVYTSKNSEKYGILIWILWVDDCLIIGHKEEVGKYKNLMQQYFECEDIGELKEYVGCKINWNKKDKSLKISQPVIIRSFQDEFGVKPDFKLETTASHGDEFVPSELDDQMNLQKQNIYRSGVGKLLFLFRFILLFKVLTGRDV
jgi:hypothetical protein